MTFKIYIYIYIKIKNWIIELLIMTMFGVDVPIKSQRLKKLTFSYP